MIAEFFMNRLILFALTIICGVILYTCVSPVAAQGLTESQSTGKIYYSSVAVIAGSSSTFLGVNVASAESITIGFVTAADKTTAAGIDLTTIGDTINSTGTNKISGTYPNISFQDGVLSGTITFLDDSQLKITFQQNNSPYFKMQDVICKTIQ